MVTKGAAEEMEKVCKYVEVNGQVLELTDELREKLREVNHRLNKQGMRVLTVAIKRDAHAEAVYTVEDEQDMIMIGFMGFLDPAKESAKTAIASLHGHGVNVKVLTGDNAIVAQKVCKDVGIEVNDYLLGIDVDRLSDEELAEKAEAVNLFAKLNPMPVSYTHLTLPTIA